MPDEFQLFKDLTEWPVFLESKIVLLGVQIRANADGGELDVVVVHIANRRPDHVLLISWLPDGYSQIFRLSMFGPSGLEDYGSASLRGKI